MLQHVIFDTTQSVTNLEFANDFLRNLRASGLEIFFSFDEAKQAVTASPSACIVLTDSAEGTKSAKVAGIPCIGLLSLSGEQNLPLAYALLESFENADVAYLCRTHAHVTGYPADILETERLLIRELSVEDFPVLYAMCTAPETAVWMDETLSDYNTEQEKHRAYISNVYPLFDLALWGVYEKCTGALIGRAGFSLPEDERDAYAIGYLIDTAYRNKGYAKECVPALLSYAKEQGITAVVARIKKDNCASLKVLAACGYSYYPEAKTPDGIVTYRIIL